MQLFFGNGDHVTVLCTTHALLQLIIFVTKVLLLFFTTEISLQKGEIVGSQVHPVGRVASQQDGGRERL